MLSVFPFFVTGWTAEVAVLSEDVAADEKVESTEIADATEVEVATEEVTTETEEA